MYVSLHPDVGRASINIESSNSRTRKDVYLFKFSFILLNKVVSCLYTSLKYFL